MLGEHAALTILLYREYDRLRRRIRRDLPADLRDVLEAEDVLQEAFVKAFQAIGNFAPQGDGSFGAWLSTITQHRLQDLIRKHRRIKAGGGRVRVRPPTSWIETVARWDHTPSASFSRRELERAVHTGLAGLPDHYREALRFRELEQLPVAEIARRMGRTEAAVHQLCARARKQLRAALEAFRSDR